MTIQEQHVNDMIELFSNKEVIGLFIIGITFLFCGWLGFSIGWYITRRSLVEKIKKDAEDSK